VTNFLFLTKREPKIHECLIFHDESKRVFNNVWAHGVLFVPLSSYEKLKNKLWELRRKYDCLDKKLTFKDISGNKITRTDCSIVIKEWIIWATEALRSKNSSFALSCKLGIFFFPSSLSLNLYGGGSKDEKLLRYFETLLRMLLKGCVHGLYDENNQVVIKGLISDGSPWHRSLSETRILERLKRELRDYVKIAKNAFIEELPSDHKSKDCNDKDKAQMLQLIDLLLGSVIHCCFRDLKYSSKKEIIVRPVREMLNKTKRGAGFRNSGYYKSFSINMAIPKNSGWEFLPVDVKEVKYDKIQLKLFD